MEPTKLIFRLRMDRNTKSQLETLAGEWDGNLSLTVRQLVRKEYRARQEAGTLPNGTYANANINTQEARS
jgi:hypothetical protein